MEEQNSMTENKRETKLGVKTKLVITKTEDFFGPGLFHLLQFIDETGSIHAASKKMKISYCQKVIQMSIHQMVFLEKKKILWMSGLILVHHIQEL